MFTPAIQYLVSLHIPLLQGDMPCIAVLRRETKAGGDDVRVVKVDEIKGREFTGDVLLPLGEMAQRLAQIDGNSDIHAHLVFSGAAFGHGEIAQLMRADWPEESWSYVSVPAGAQLPDLVTTEESLPMNHFRVPRLALIGALNLAYATPGRIAFVLPPDRVPPLMREFSEFSERTAKLPANDPDAILEYVGEGRVMALATLIWHHLNAQRVRAGWAREYTNGP